MKMREPHGTIRFRESRGCFIVNYYDRAGARHQERRTTKRAAEALLKLRLDQIKRGTFSAEIVFASRNANISDAFTPDRKLAYSERMKNRNLEEEFRAKVLVGIEKSNTPALIDQRRQTLKTTLADPKVKARQLRQLRKTTRSEQANASRSAIIRSMHAQTGLTGDQVLSLLAAAKRVRDRDWIVLLLMFWHRLRPDEVRKLTPRHLAGGSIAIPTGGVEALVSHGESLLDERKSVEIWLSSHGSDDFLFYNSCRYLHRLIHRYAHDAGLPKTLGHAHVLRNSIEARERLGGPSALRVRRTGRPKGKRSFGTDERLRYLAALMKLGRSRRKHAPNIYPPGTTKESAEGNANMLVSRHKGEIASFLDRLTDAQAEEILKRPIPQF